MKQDDNNISIDDQKNDHQYNDYTDDYSVSDRIDRIRDTIEDAKDTYDDVKDTYDRIKKAKEFNENMRSASKAKDAANNGQYAAKEGGKQALEKAGAEAGKGAMKSGAGTTGTGATGAAGGAGGAAGGAGGAAGGAGGAAGGAGGAAGGAGGAAGGAGGTAAAPVIGGVLLVVIIIIIVVIVIVFIATFASQLFLASEETYSNIYDIIDYRTKEKPLIKMDGNGKADSWNPFTSAGDDLSKIMLDDTNETYTNSSGQEVQDVSIRTYLEVLANGEYDNYLPTLTRDATIVEDTDIDKITEERLNYIGRFLMAERESFNMINWYVRDADSTEPEKIEHELEVNTDFETIDETVVDAFTSQGQHTLFYPKSGTYNLSEDGMSRSDTLDAYINLTKSYLQDWSIPFSTAVASYDSYFGIDVLQYAKHYVEVELIQIRQQSRNKTIVSTSSGDSTSYGSPSDLSHYKYVPKVAYAETLFEIETNNYSVKPIDMNESPDKSEVISSESRYNSVTGEWISTTTVYKETWYEDVELDDSEKETYKVSYLNDNPGDEKEYDYNEEGENKNLGAPITRIEWAMDSGAEGYTSYPSKETEEAIEWFDKLYSNSMGFEMFTEFTNYNDEDISFTTKEELSDFLKYKYQTLPEGFRDLKQDILDIETLTDGIEDESDVAFREELAELLGVESVPNKTPEELYTEYYADLIVPHNYSELYMAYNQIEQHYSENGDSLNNYFSESTLDVSNIPYGGFAWPVNPEPESHYTITSVYGLRDFDASPNHTGVDIAAPTGTPIYAAHDGEITYYGWGGGYGNFVKIRSSDNQYETAYAHLDAYVAGYSVGQTVKKGELIGYMGNTGNSFGAHLHYETKIVEQATGKTQTLDPLLFYNLNLPYSNDVNDKFDVANKRELKYVSSKGFADTTKLESFINRFDDPSHKVNNQYLAYEMSNGKVAVGNIVYQDNTNYFKEHGITSMVAGDLIAASIVEEIEEISLNKAYSYVMNYINTNEITDLEQHHIDALVSRQMSANSIIGFEAVWSKNKNNVEALWDEFFKNPYTNIDGEKQVDLMERRFCEFRIFTTGNYNASKSGYIQAYGLEEE